jgi:hypothetical protein
MRSQQNKEDPQFKVTRRTLLTAGGATLVGATLFGLPFDNFVDAQNRRGVTTKNGGMKPTVLPRENTRDPVDFSVAENAFWNEQLMEHAVFFQMLMPGPELAAQREQAMRFQQEFAAQLQQSKTASFDRNNYAAFNRSSADMARRFVEWKRRHAQLQTSGSLKSLVWPTFFEHTANEAERFAARLDQFSRGDTSTNMNEAAKFWTMIMGEHADFVAHLLDPKERELIQKAMQTSDAFQRMNQNPPGSKNPLEKAVNDIIDFKTAAERGIQTGKIKSIIHPTLADHVRREALKAADELKRAS